MNKKYQNGFFIFGIVVLVIMISQLNFHQVWEGLQHAGYWSLAVVALWAALYLLNTSAWYIIIHSQPRLPAQRPISFACVGICTQLCHSWRFNGRRTLSHHVPIAQDWNREGFVFGHPLCNDSHL